ncbi:hypothetical protein LIER_11102 [Lithospermum erythrorhizon]|uniref:Uncharacterized protein n=1 Tax=Lithospermum erythrorhizon TaxID=34254 RepID=A0AAV3PLU5_LITER
MLRDVIKPHVKYKVENGKTVNYLYDNWSFEGVMAEALSARERSVLGLLSTDSVADFCNVPKFSFIAWLLCLRRLPTKDRLENWSVIEDSLRVGLRRLKGLLAKVWERDEESVHHGCCISYLEVQKCCCL